MSITKEVPSIADMVVCILCLGSIPHSEGDPGQFVEHMNTRHQAFHNLEFVLAGCLLKEEERDLVMQTFRGIATNIENIDGDTSTVNIEDDPLENLPSKSKPDEQDEKGTAEDLDIPIDTLLDYELKGAISALKYECDLCDYQTKRRQGLSEHQKSVHDGMKHDCAECDKKFTTKRSLKQHKLSLHDGNKFSCNQCSFQTPRQNNLNRHIKAFHEGMKYSCNLCSSKFTWIFVLNKHQRDVHSGIQHLCNICNNQLNSAYSLKRHQESVQCT